MGPESERALLVALQGGDARAFDRVYALHGGRIWNFLARMTGKKEIAEDLFQETWIKLAIHAPRLTADTNLAAWLYTVARNLARSERRTARAAPKTESVSDETHHQGASPLEWATASETEQCLERALADLPGPFREVLLLVVVEGLDHELVASILGLTREAVRQRLARARAKLSERLDELSESPRTTMKEEPHAARRPAL